MKEQSPFSIEKFYKHVDQKKLMGSKCKKCGTAHLPPRILCQKCLSKQMESVELPQRGKLLTYTIIHVAPTQFQEMTPYAVGIIQLGDGVKVPGIIKHVNPEDINIGMELSVKFNSKKNITQWPQWTRYYLSKA
ncbi:MAG: Zn-ribbon domain-containing OB-fold protein [Candidatus Bathyarchaeota archaeon]|jgi:hypothetical protein